MGAAAPETEMLRRLIAEQPEALGSLSIGRPDAGALLNAVPMPEDPLWVVRDGRDAWATEETVAFLATAISKVESQHPGSAPLSIGDLSRRSGGRIDRHRSHESGRDADLGWYFADGTTGEMRRGTPKNLDLSRCWALVRALITETDVERIFIDRALQQVLFRYALSVGDDRDWLMGLFANVSGRDEALIQHERGHKTHLHVRFFNRHAQEWGHAAYPLLVEAGLAPPPVVQHRARRGETLSQIARRYGTSVRVLRTTNGLRSSAIRAGRRYRIPVCLAAAPDAAPLVWPVRRLPPVKAADLATTGE